MYMGVIDRTPGSEALRQLANVRVLITGLSTAAGVDLARTFAESQARLIVHTDDLSPEMTALMALLSETAGDIKLYTDRLDAGDASIKLAQAAAQAYGGIDIAINVAPFSYSDADSAHPEALVGERLSPMLQITQVIANRMRLLATDGMILNVVAMPVPRNGRECALASLVHSTLTDMTRGLANEWAPSGIRINAVGPKVLTSADESGAQLASEPDIATLAVYLATKPAHALSGFTFAAAVNP